MNNNAMPIQKKHLLFSHQKLKEIHHNSIWNAKDEKCKLDFYIFYLFACLNVRIKLKVKHKFIGCNENRINLKCLIIK